MAKRTLSNVGMTVILVILVSFFYVYQRIQIFRLGYKIRNVERKLTSLREENSVLQLKISQLISPEHIAGEIKRLGLDLVPPKEKQVVRVK